jgi:hypothetical protein
MALYRVGDRVLWEAATPPPASLVTTLRAHKAELLPLVPARASADPAFVDVDTPRDWLGLRVYSSLLDREVWLVRDAADASQLENEIGAEGETAAVVFTVAEVLAVEGMIEADRRVLLAAVERVKRAMPAVLDGVIRREELLQ